MEYVRMAILSAYDKVCAHMDNEADEALHYYDDELTEYLKGTAATFTFSVNAQHPDSQFLTEGNKISFTRREKDYYMNIMHVERNEYEVTVEAYSLSFELLNEQRGAYKAASAMSFEEYLAVFDPEHVITLGTNEVSEKRITNEWTGEDTILSRLFSLATVFSAELEFLPELNDNYSLKRIVMNVYQEHSDTNQGVGQKRTDLTLRYNHEISGITKVSDITELYTAITPTGRDGLTLASLDKTEYDSEGNVEYRKPAGSPHLYAVQARDRFPSNLMANENERYIGVNWEYDTDNVNTLYGQSLAQLKANCVPKVTYEVEGYFDTGIGDTVMIADESFNPELYLEARVTEQRRSFTDPSRNKTTFNNFKELQNQIDESLLARVEELIAQGKTYTGMISSDNGIVFKNGIGNTTLTAHVRDGSGTDITENFEIHWYKDGEESYIGNPYLITATDVETKAVYRFDAVDAKGAIKASYEVTVSNVDDGSTPEIGDNGNWVINGEDTGKPSQGEPGPAGNPTGIIVSETEPENPYDGMLWKHTGTVGGLIKNATYRWSEGGWELYLFTAENIDVQTLSAIVANLGNVTAGSLKVEWKQEPGEDTTASGTTYFSDESGDGQMKIDYVVKNKSESIVSQGSAKYGYDGIYLTSTDNEGKGSHINLTYTGLDLSDGDHSAVLSISDITRLKTAVCAGGTTFAGDMDIKTLSPGFYFCNFINITNAPYTSGYGVLEKVNLDFSGDAYMEKIYRYNNGYISEIAYRIYINSKWYDWTYISTNGAPWNALNLINNVTESEGRTPMYKNTGKRVEFTGQIAKASGTFTTSAFVVATLPEGSRPSENKLFAVADDTFKGARVAVLSSGLIQVQSANNSGYVSLDGIAFDLD